MQQNIGSTAGQVWSTLHQKGESTATGLVRSLHEESPVVYMALGWLAREGKINYHMDGKRIFVSLNSGDGSCTKM